MSFVDLHTAEFKSNIVLKQYAWPTYGFLDENVAYLFITNLRCRSCTAVLHVLILVRSTAVVQLLIILLLLY